MANPNRPAFGKITAATKWRRVEGRIKGGMVLPHLLPILGEASPLTGLDESKSAILSTMRLYLSLTTHGWMRSRHLIQEWLILDLDELACIELCCKSTLAKRRKHHIILIPVYIRVCSVWWAHCTSSLWPHGLQPTRLLCPWGSPGKNTGVGRHALLQGIFPAQGLKLCLPCLLHGRKILSHWAHGDNPSTHEDAGKWKP